ncbi:MAG: hypothetical protein BWY78_01306 [Alphaproteobacteria bacterium ADurb.Bin438]|nr:MAG: hypothetical protein BWY78_01306 [Alphaproteobacteria bacterium ADurb.Bin438]
MISWLLKVRSFIFVKVISDKFVPINSGSMYPVNLKNAEFMYFMFPSISTMQSPDGTLFMTLLKNLLSLSIASRIAIFALISSITQTNSLFLSFFVITLYQAIPFSFKSRQISVSLLNFPR